VGRRKRRASPLTRKGVFMKKKGKKEDKKGPKKGK